MATRDGVTKPVTIFSEQPIPANQSYPVTIHYKESGVRKRVTIQMSTATRFDSLVVAGVQETIRAKLPWVKPNSPSNFMRLGYRSIQYLDASIHAPRKLAPAVLDTRAAEPNNISHLLLHIIPYCLYAQGIVGKDVVFLFRKLHGQFRDLPPIFGLTPRFEHRNVEAQVIKVSGTRGFALYDLIDVFDCVAFNYMPDVYSNLDFASSVGFDKVFLARRGSRGLINQGEIEKLLERYGYKTLFLEDYPLLEQLSIGARAKKVVAVHGAALGCLAVNKGLDSVIEVMPPNSYFEAFPVALCPLVKHYQQVIPDFDRAVAHSGWPAISYYGNHPFRADPGMLEDCLSYAC